MNKTISWSQSIHIVGIPLALIALMLLLVNSSLFQFHPSELSVGITLDLTLTIPLVYLFLIRKRPVPKITVIPFFISGIFLAGLVIPQHYHSSLALIKAWILPAVELIIVFVIVTNVRKTIKHYSIHKIGTPDFYTALKNASRQILPERISLILSTEIAVFYYAFFSWQKRKLNANEFSYHKTSGTTALLFTIIFLIIAETSIAHLVLQKWNSTIAWMLSIVGIYGAVQFISLARSMSKRPIAIGDGVLELRYGFFSESTIPLQSIASIDLSSKPIELNYQTKKLSLLGNLESHNIIIQLKKENDLALLYGFKTTYRAIAFYVDEKEKFVNAVKDKVASVTPL